MVYKFFDKKTSLAGSGINSISNRQLADELHNQLLENLKDEMFIHHLKTIFGGRSCWHAINKQIQQRS